MADIQIDIGFAILLIGWPVYHLLAGQPYTKKDDNFYTHLTGHSAIFPKWRIIFPTVWTLLWCFNGAGAWLFWHAYAAGDNDTTYLVGLIFYTISFIFQCGWYNMFFRRRMLKTSFFVTFFVIWGSQVGYFVCTILYPEIVSAVASGLTVAWLTYATAMTGVAAFLVPDHAGKDAEARLLNHGSARNDEEHGMAESSYGQPRYGGGYDASGAQVVGNSVPATSTPATATKFPASGGPVQRKTASASTGFSASSLAVPK